MTDTGLPARRAALAILSGVLQKRRPLDAGLDHLAGLSTRDAGFARALVSETLRHMGALDAALRKFMAKPLAPHKAGAASEILLLGACELLILKVAAHAAVMPPTTGGERFQGRALQAADQCGMRKVAGRASCAVGMDRERLSRPTGRGRWTAVRCRHRARSPAPISRRAMDIVLKSTRGGAPGEACSARFGG